MRFLQNDFDRSSHFCLKKEILFLNAINRSDFNNDVSATFYQKQIV